MTNEYDVGDRIKLSTSTAFADSAGTAFDPDVVRFKVRDPAGTTTTYVYGTDANVTKVATGDYECEVDVDTAGMWLYRIEGEQSSGENRGADEGRFVVIIPGVS